ncbi:MAG: orotidine 5'-phosphate decarboxylase / HUMPS family protein, partial [Deinococcota bacterium]
MRPKLQLALDNLDLQSALSAVQQASQHIDVIEVGTILCLAEGMNAVQTIRTLYPQHIVLADVRVVKAGAVIAKMVFDAGADWVSVVSEASAETVEAVVKEARARGRDVQIELADTWTEDQLKLWRGLDLQQVIYHPASEVSDLQADKWTAKNLDTIHKLHALGFKVTVTGGMTVSDIPKFKDVPVYAFISGRAIAKANNPAEAA